MKKHSHSFETKLNNISISDTKHTTALNAVNKYIDYTLNTTEQINIYVPNKHIANVFTETLVLLELEHTYQQEFQELGITQQEYFNVVNIHDIVLYDFNKTELTNIEVERVYQLRRAKDDYIRQCIKLIHTRMPDYVIDNFTKIIV